MRTVLLDVTVPGKPVGAERPRAGIRGSHASMFMSSKHRNNESFAVDRFAAGWVGLAPLDVPVTVEIDVVVERPQALCRPGTARSAGSPRMRIPCTTKPDVDNVAKLQLDALVKAGVLRDDTRVCRLTVTKMYRAMDPDESAHVRVKVLRWEP